MYLFNSFTNNLGKYCSVELLGFVLSFYPSVCREEIEKEIQASEFVAIECD